jgi:hypothetical protein
VRLVGVLGCVVVLALGACGDNDEVSSTTADSGSADLSEASEDITRWCELVAEGGPEDTSEILALTPDHVRPEVEFLSAVAEVSDEDAVELLFSAEGLAVMGRLQKVADESCGGVDLFGIGDLQGDLTDDVVGFVLDALSDEFGLGFWSGQGVEGTRVLFLQVDVAQHDAQAICERGAALLLDQHATTAVFRVEVYDPDGDFFDAEVAAEQQPGTTSCITP